MPEKKSTKKKGPERVKFEVVEFGKRVALIRESLLGMSQSKLAPMINTRQALLSRLEAGIGGNIHIVFEIVDYLNSKGFRGHMLFREEFDITLFKSEVGEMENKKNLVEELENIEKASKENYEKIIALKNLIS
jgi:hypothetical protein